MSQPLPNPQISQANSPTDTPARRSLTAEERSVLLRIAHTSIEAQAHGRTFAPAAPMASLAEQRGVFTTIYLRKKLRGCVGYITAVAPLYLAVAETARAAAFEDTRFTPVRADEAGELEVSLSVLSLPREINPNDVEIGRHGLLISQHGRRGLLLPQVATEHGWDREMFLRETCYKAGLPPDAWEHGARVEAFTAEVFSDSDEGEALG